MLRWFVNLLYGSAAAQFDSPHPVEESVALLAGVVKPSIASVFSGPCAVGMVTEKWVSIRREVPFVRNSWKPCFVGAFEWTGTQTILKGRFGFSGTTKVLMSIWFGFIALCIVRTTVSVASDPSVPLSFPLFGVALFCVGILTTLSGKHSARKDVDWLSTVISGALHTQPASIAHSRWNKPD